MPERSVTPKKEETPARRVERIGAYVDGFMCEYAKESDRAAVILCAAKLDYLLLQILTKYLVPVPSGNDDFLSSDRARGTFSARITACYRLGLISPELARALNIFRRVRNDFAHEVSGGSLSSGSHRDRIRELADPFSRYKTFDGLQKMLVDRAGLDAGERVRLDFFAATTLLTSRLEILLDRLEPVATKPLGLIPESYLGELKNE